MARQNHVYFIQAVGGGPIKIGRSVDVERRLTVLKNVNADDLRVLATISCDAALEGELHQRFAAFRLSGEWFSPEPSLLEFVASLPHHGTATIASVRARLFTRKDFGGPANIDEVLAAKLRNLASDNSRRAYASDWQKWCAWLVVQGIEVLKATPRIVRAFVAHLHEVGLVRPTVSRNLSVIREVYGAFVADELIAVNPAREIKNPRVSHVPKTPHLNEDGVRAVLAVPAETWQERRARLAVLLLFGLGWRRSEVARLQVDKYVDGTVTGIVKGNKSLTVGVPEWLQNEIADWLAYANIESGALLPRSEGNLAEVSGDMVYQMVRQISKKAGVKINPHGLRRTNITLGGKRGVDLRKRQLAVGHSKQATTELYDMARNAAENAPGQIFEDLLPKTGK